MKRQKPPSLKNVASPPKPVNPPNAGSPKAALQTKLGQFFTKQSPKVEKPVETIDDDVIEVVKKRKIALPVPIQPQAAAPPPQVLEFYLNFSVVEESSGSSSSSSSSEEKTPKKSQPKSQVVEIPSDSSLPQGIFEKNEKAGARLQKSLAKRNHHKKDADGETVYQLTGKSVKYTPLEKQVIHFKQLYPDVVLFVEVGYKYQFFGKDAEIAAKVLNIFCVMHNSFLAASIPVHRLYVHLRRIVEAGYKVGVIRQTETAALKKIGDKANTVFERKLTNMYTRSTLVDFDSIDGAQADTSYLMCLFEKPMKNTATQAFSMLAIHLATGSLVYDEWSDDTLRAELEARLNHLNPAELVLLPKLSGATENVLSAYVGASKARVERFDTEQWTDQSAETNINAFYASLPSSVETLSNVELPSGVRICLGVAIKYLNDFPGLSRVLHLTRSILPYRATHHMHLNGPTLKNLNIFEAEAGTKGTIYGQLNKCRTVMGSRLLRRWLMHPLMDLQLINQRQDVVRALQASSSQFLLLLTDLLKTLPDLERGLARIQYRTSHPSECLTVLSSFKRVCTIIEGRSEEPKLDLIDALLDSIDLPSLSKSINSLLSEINQEPALVDDVTNSLHGASFPALFKLRGEMESIKQSLEDEKESIAKELKVKSFSYFHMAQERYLIEVPKSAKVPSGWTVVSKTAQMGRYRSPAVVELLTLMAQTTERLQAAAKDAWEAFLTQCSAALGPFHATVSLLATVDCLSAFSSLDWVLPSLSDGPQHIRIVDGRHPLVESVLDTPYVPNDTEMSATGERCLIVTGPNMGGKSSYIRHIALIVILAQIGAPVPASSASLSLFDAVFTRMGASDDIHKGQSTFFIELHETAQILRERTDRSLIILDELGRGTSTHDGVAIAYSVLRHLLLNTQSFTLFVTHYQSLANALVSPHLANCHMSFVEAEEENKIIFLYKAVRGAAHNSYGLNVARIAGIPASIINTAAIESARLKKKLTSAELSGQFARIFADSQ